MNNNDNTNILHVTEKRSFVDKSKRKMEKIRQGYKEKMIDTGRSQKLEEQIDKQAKRTKKAIKVAGTISTIVLIFIPADGPFGEMATFFATPALCALVDVCADLKKKALITGKRGFEKHILNVDGSNEKVTGFDLNNKESFIKDFKDLKNKVSDFENARSK